MRTRTRRCTRVPPLASDISVTRGNYGRQGRHDVGVPAGDGAVPALQTATWRLVRIPDALAFPLASTGRLARCDVGVWQAADPRSSFARESGMQTSSRTSATVSWEGKQAWKRIDCSVVHVWPCASAISTPVAQRSRRVHDGKSWRLPVAKGARSCPHGLGGVGCEGGRCRATVRLAGVTDVRACAASFTFYIPGTRSWCGHA